MAETKYTDSSTSIINRCKNGERKAFYELYNLYARAMFNVSMRILNDRNEAEDVLQEAFLKAFQKIKDFDGRASFGIWLKRIIINRSIDVIRKQKQIFQTMDNAAHIEAEEPAEEDMVYDVNSVIKAIRELSDGYRIVLTLYLFEDYNHKEIASRLNITEGTSKSQYNRAKKKLIERINKNKFSDE